MEYLWVAWLFPAFYFTWIAYCAIRNMRYLQGKSLEYSLNPSCKLIFEIATNGKNVEAVNRSLRALKTTLESFTGTFRMVIATDEGCPVNYEMGDVSICPKSFKCNAVKKARSLQYTILERGEKEDNAASTWVLHLDDESIVTKQCLASIVHHINSEGEPISEGWIIYPHDFTKASLLTGLADCIRPIGCCECREILKLNLVTHLHGSNLLIRADVEERVGWDYNSIAEDSVFGIKAITLGYKIGWHGGVLEEQPVRSIRDLAGQRRRWFNGQRSNLRAFPMPLKLKILSYVRLMIWFFGFPAALISWVAMIGYVSAAFASELSLAIKLVLLPGTLAWILSYQFGVFWNTKLLRWPERLWYHLAALVFIAIVGLVETWPAFTFFLGSLGKRKGEFYTIKKD